MDNPVNQHSMHDRIAAAIKQGQVTMRPKWYFILRAILALVGGILIALVLLFLISMIIFTLRQTGAGFAPAFGARGWMIFLRSLPWLLITLSLVFVFILELLARRYSFAYQRPLLYSALAIVILMVGGGFIIAGTSLHRQVARYAQDNHLPIGEGFYRGLRQQQFKNIYPGVIVATTTDGLMLYSRRGDMLTIIVTPETRIADESGLMTDQPVVVFGERITSGTIRAFGIRLIDADF